MKSTPASDDRLIARHLEGDDSAFEELVDRYGARLVGAVESVVGDRHLAMDVAQEVFVRLCEILPRYRPLGRFRSLLFSMALNSARDARRRQKRSRLIFWEDRRPASEEPLAPDPAGRRDERAAIEAALERVANPFREAVYLRDVGGLSYEELAGSLGCSLGTAKSRVHRGRMEFRTAYRAVVHDRRDPNRGGNHAS